MHQTTIESLVPHRGRMKLLDQVLEACNNTATTGAFAKQSWPLVSENRVDILVIVELIAQTSAIAIGWQEYRNNPGNFQGKGWLVGIKSADFYFSNFLLDSWIITRSEVSFDMENYFEIQGNSKIGTKCLGEVVIQILKTNK